ncbi:MAG: cadherin domain-containing protein [Chloroflexota bacterium]
MFNNIAKNDQRRFVSTLALLLTVTVAIFGFGTASAAIGDITTIAGTGVIGYAGDNGPATDAQFFLPFDVEVDANGNIFVADSINAIIRKIDVNTGIITTFAGVPLMVSTLGDGEPATVANLNTPMYLTVDGNGNLLISDAGNHRIRRVDAVTGIITTVAGTGNNGHNGDGGLATEADLSAPRGIAVDSQGNLFIAESGGRIRKVDATTGIITTAVGTGVAGYSGDGGPAQNAQIGNIFFTLTIDSSDALVFADVENRRIRRVDPTTGNINTIAGTGVQGVAGDGGSALDAQFMEPSSVVYDTHGNLLIADMANFRIRKVDAATGIITTVAGNGTKGYSGDNGPALNAQMDKITALTVDNLGNLVIAGSNNGVVRQLQFVDKPRLAIPDSIINVSDGLTFTVPISLATNGHNMPSTGFSINYDQSCLVFNETDTDNDGLFDAVQNTPAGFQVVSVHNTADVDGELDIALYYPLSPPVSLSDGIIINLEFIVDDGCVVTDGSFLNTVIDFSSNPAPSFSNASGRDITGTATGATIPLSFNQAPTDIFIDGSLSGTAVNENEPVGTVIGSLSSVDVNSQDVHTYSLTGGDVSAFSINGTALETAALFDYEAKNSYTISITTDDGHGKTFEKAFTITISDVNEAPTNIDLSNAAIDENQPVGTAVGTLNTTDEDVTDLHTYRLTGGDVSAFTIADTLLETAAIFDYEVKSSYTISITTDDGRGKTFEKAFTITISDVNEAPTNISLSSAAIDENQPVGTPVGTLTTTDEDLADFHNYTIVGGDVSAFTVNDDLVSTAAIFNHEVKASYAITVRSTDHGDSSVDIGFTILVNDINDAPVAVNDPADPINAPIIAIGGIEKWIVVNSNDTDEDQLDSLTVNSVTNGTHGTTTNQVDYIAYTSTDPTFNGTDTFTYEITDNNTAGSPNGALTDTASVEVAIVANNPRGDCNSSGNTGIADVVAIVLELFDGDSDTRWWEIYQSGYAGSPLGCDANATQTVSFADIACTVLVFFGDNACTTPVARAASVAPATLSAENAAIQGRTVTVPVHLTSRGSDIGAIGFSLDFDNSQFRFDETDADGNGLPDAVRFNVSNQLTQFAQFNADTNQVDIAVYGLSLPLKAMSDGVMATVELHLLDDVVASSDTQITLVNGSAGTTGGHDVMVDLVGGLVNTNGVSGTDQVNRVFLPLLLK